MGGGRTDYIHVSGIHIISRGAWEGDVPPLFSVVQFSLNYAHASKGLIVKFTMCGCLNVYKQAF